MFFNWKNKPTYFLTMHYSFLQFCWKDIFFNFLYEAENRNKKEKKLGETHGLCFQRNFVWKHFAPVLPVPLSFIFPKRPSYWEKWKKLKIKAQNCKFILKGSVRVCLDFLPNFVSLRIYFLCFLSFLLPSFAIRVFFSSFYCTPPFSFLQNFLLFSPLLFSPEIPVFPKN